MAKLYFRYGTVGSAKTMNLLAVAHNYRSQNKEILLLKPALDDRFGAETIKSRSGLEMDADILIHEGYTFEEAQLTDINCLLVDEAQFLTAGNIDHLREISQDYDIPVICYGLRTDFKTNLFTGSQRLFEVADSIEEIKTTCAFCNRKAIFNLKSVDGKPTAEGPVVDLGADEKYQPACSDCYHDKLSEVAAGGEAQPGSSDGDRGLSQSVQ